MVSSYSQAVAAEVRAEVARQRRSQGDLAAKMGWKQPYISRRLVGEVAFDIDELARLADELGVPLEQFTRVTEGATPR